MKRELLHIWGPFSINSFGLFIAIGILVFYHLIRRHALFEQLKLENKISNIIIFCIVVGLTGGRMLSVLTDFHSFESWHSMLVPWVPAFSITGALIAVIVTLPPFLHHLRIPVLPFLDLAALYIPILHAISRVGCFFAGCCFGRMTQLPWAIVYTDPLSAAPLHVPLHPTQLYSSLFYLGIFICLAHAARKWRTQPGSIFLLYLILANSERFFVDFLRDDRIIAFHFFGGLFSIDQLLALTVGISAFFLNVWVQRRPHKTHEYI